MKPPLTIPTSDPNSVDEMLCIGKHNISISDGFATLTFTHVRSEPHSLMDHGIIQPTSIVKARIVMGVGNLADLRKTIDEVLTKVQLLTAETVGAAN